MLIATPKATNANAYCTEAEASAYLTEERPHTAAAWVAASTADREKAIIWATFILDNSMDWYGSRRTIEQALKWPRSGVHWDNVWFDYDTIPSLLVKATAELAMALLKRDRTLEPDLLGKGFSKVSAGPVDITVDPEQVLPVVPTYIFSILEPLGVAKNPGTGDRTVSLVRV